MENILIVLNYFAVSWISIVSIWILASLIFNIRLAHSHFKVSIMISLVAFTVFAYNYKPTIYTDLYRYYETLDYMRTTGSSFYNSNEFITTFLFEMVAKSEDNHLLPLIVTFIRYSLYFLLLYKYCKSREIGSYTTKLYIFFSFAFLPLIESISGVRYYLAISIFCYALLSDYFIKKKALNVFFMISTLFIHTSSLMFIGLRVMSMKLIYDRIKIFRFIIILWSFLIIQVADIASNIGVPFIQIAAETLIYYMTEDREISFNLILSRAIILVSLYLMYSILKRNPDENFRSNEGYYNFIELSIFFTAGSIFYDVLFQRNIFFIVLASLPLFISFFENDKISKSTRKLFILVILILSFGMYLNQIYGIANGYF